MSNGYTREYPRMGYPRKQADDIAYIRKLAAAGRQRELALFMIEDDLEEVVMNYACSHSDRIKSIEELNLRRGVWSNSMLMSLDDEPYSIPNYGIGESRLEGLPTDLLVILAAKSFYRHLDRAIKSRVFTIEHEKRTRDARNALLEDIEALSVGNAFTSFEMNGSAILGDAWARERVRAAYTCRSCISRTVDIASALRNKPDPVANTHIEHALAESIMIELVTINPGWSGLMSMLESRNTAAKRNARVAQYDDLKDLCYRWAVRKDPLKNACTEIIGRERYIQKRYKDSRVMIKTPKA